MSLVAPAGAGMGLSAATLARICATLARFPQVEQGVLYGSRAKGNFKPGSDIDLTLRGDGLTLSLLGDIDAALDDLLLPYEIDLSIYGTARSCRAGGPYRPGWAGDLSKACRPDDRNPPHRAAKPAANPA